MATVPQGDAIPTTMTAWTHTSAGIPSKVLQLSPDVTLPGKFSATDDVLVRVTHAALNPGGSIMMQLCPMFFRAKPAIPELDFSGEIVAIGSEVPVSRALSVGSPVFGSISIESHLRLGVGALAEYVIVTATNVVRKPENMSFEEAAGLAVVGCTAVPLIEGAKLGRGDSVLVNGASGGIGTMVVQLAKEAVGESGKVVAICSSRNLELVKSLGADEVSSFKCCVRFSVGTAEILY
jgi:reticulon-4-interacting protein 1, mitochondrial